MYRHEEPAFAELVVAYRLAHTMRLTVMAQMVKGVAAEIPAEACREEEHQKLRWSARNSLPVAGEDADAGRRASR